MKSRSFIAMAFAFLATLWGQQPHPKLSRELNSAAGTGETDVIVQYVRSPGSSQRSLAESKGARWKNDLTHIRATHYSAPTNRLRELANDADVEFISPDRTVQGTLDVTAP